MAWASDYAEIGASLLTAFQIEKTENVRRRVISDNKESIAEAPIDIRAVVRLSQTIEPLNHDPFAESVMDALISKGIPPAHLTALAYAEALRDAHIKQEFEWRISSAKKNGDLDKALRTQNINVFYEDEHWGAQPNCLAAATAARRLLETGDYNGISGYVYAVLLGIMWWHHGTRGIKYCECCQWRLARIGHYQGRLYCKACATSRDTPTSKTINRQERVKAKIARNTSEFQGFMNVREKGEYYLLRLALGIAEKPSIPLECDKFDVIPDADYRSLKEALSNVWDQTRPNSRTRQAEATVRSLQKLADNGLTKAEAARTLGISRAAVTYACRRSEQLSNTFTARPAQRLK